MPSPDAVPRPGLSWTWSGAALGAVFALPAAIAALNDPQHGVALAFGVIPAAIIGLPARRRGRRVLLVLGFLAGVPILLGALLAHVPVLAVAALGALGVGAALLAAARPRVGMVAMSLSLPMVGVGLSYPEIGTAAELAGLMILGSAYAWAIAMLWPERPAAVAAKAAGGPGGAASAAGGPTLGYGVRLGAAGATAAAVGFIAGLEHVGWACAAALLVMRPAAEMQRLRSVGRVIAVVVGSLAAIALIRLEPADVWYSAVVLVAVAGATATGRSRWYVTPAFTTFLVFLLLLIAEPSAAAARFDERLVETVLGVGIAYFYGLLLPRVVAARRA